jgi:uncharacterized protein YukE
MRTSDGGGYGAITGSTYTIKTVAVTADSASGLSASDIEGLFSQLDPAATAQAGSAHANAGQTLAEIAESLVRHVQVLSQNWSGTAAQAAVGNFQQLHQTAIGLAQASTQTGAVLCWLGEEILPYYKNYKAPSNGVVGDVESLFGDNPQNKAAQAVMERLNNRLVQANEGLPSSVSQHLSLTDRYTGPSSATTGGVGSGAGGAGQAANGLSGAASAGGGIGGLTRGGGAGAGGIGGIGGLGGTGSLGSGSPPPVTHLAGTPPPAGPPGSGLTGSGAPGSGAVPGAGSGIPGGGPGGGAPAGAGGPGVGVLGVPGSGVPGSGGSGADGPGGDGPGDLGGAADPGEVLGVSGSGVSGSGVGGESLGSEGMVGVIPGDGAVMGADGMIGMEPAGFGGDGIGGWADSGIEMGDPAAGAIGADGTVAAGTAGSGTAGFPVLGSATGQQETERRRQAWMAEDADVWESQADLVPALIQ